MGILRGWEREMHIFLSFRSCCHCLSLPVDIMIVSQTHFVLCSRGKGTPNISREPWGHEAINSAATGPVRAEEEAQGKLQPFSTIHQIYSRKSEEHFVTFLNQAVFRNTELNLPMQTAI